MASQSDANLLSTNASAFLKKHVVRVKMGYLPTDQGNVQAALVDATDGVLEGLGRRRSALGVKVDAGSFMVCAAVPNNSKVPNGSPVFSAVWSGYVPGEERDATLPAVGGPGIMLTPELTGCTVVASIENDGSARFSHYNLKNGSKTLSTESMLEYAAIDYAGKDFSTLSKEEYYAAGVHSTAVSVTVVGVRASGVWSSWAQFNERKDGRYSIREVRKIA